MAEEEFLRRDRAGGVDHQSEWRGGVGRRGSPGAQLGRDVGEEGAGEGAGGVAAGPEVALEGL